jgi:hypothetical protein
MVMIFQFFFLDNRIVPDTYHDDRKNQHHDSNQQPLFAAWLPFLPAHPVFLGKQASLFLMSGRLILFFTGLFSDQSTYRYEWCGECCIIPALPEESSSWEDTKPGGPERPPGFIHVRRVRWNAICSLVSSPHKAGIQQLLCVLGGR